MANRDNWYAQTPQRARQRILDIYTNRGIAPPTSTKLDAMVQNVMERGAWYFDTIRDNPQRYVSSPPDRQQGGSNRDQFYARDRRLAELRIRDIYEKRGLPAPPSEKLGRMVDNVLKRGAWYFNTIRDNPQRYLPPGAPPVDEEPPPVDFRHQAKMLFAGLGLPDELYNTLIDAYVEANGDIDLAWAEVRFGKNKSLYDQFFPGNRRPDGSLRYSEQEYRTIEGGYANTLINYGINPDPLRHRFGEMIAGEKSVQEFAGQVGAIYAGLVNGAEETRAKFQQWYGVDFQGPTGNPRMDAGMLVMALDPDLGTDLLNQRISLAQIGGTAQRFGFDRSLERVTELSGYGVGAEAAANIYGQAADVLPGLNAMARRWDAYDPDFGIGEFEDFALMDAGQQRRVRRLRSQEQAIFQPGALFEQDEDGGISGLVAR